MTQNPFGEGFDLGAMLEQATAMQSQMMAAQQELADSVIEGTAGAVTAQVSGTGELVGLSIAADSFDGSDAESLTDLADLVVAAYRAAKAQADQLGQDKMGAITGGLDGLGGSLGGSLGGPGV